MFFIILIQLVILLSEVSNTGPLLILYFVSTEVNDIFCTIAK